MMKIIKLKKVRGIKTEFENINGRLDSHKYALNLSCIFHSAFHVKKVEKFIDGVGFYDTVLVFILFNGLIVKVLKFTT